MTAAFAISCIIVAFWLLWCVVPSIEEPPMHETLDKWMANWRSRHEFRNRKPTQPQRQANTFIAAFKQRRAA